MWAWLVSLGSGEWLLTGRRIGWSNGGGTISARALWTAAVVYSIALGLRNALDPTQTWSFDRVELQRQLVSTLPWFGAIVAGTYTALYARFASQFTYLANLFNQIKAQECSSDRSDALFEWKAGFIEDAEVLHLARKPIFASVISAWANEPGVRAKYGEHVPGGEVRLDAVIAQVDRSLERTRKKYATTE